MSPFEALNGRKCRTLLMWSFFGKAVIKEAEENVSNVTENLKVAHSRWKSYTNNRRRDLRFQVGDFVYLKVPPLRGTKRFHIRGKLAAHFIGPYQILSRTGKLAYKLELPESLARVHPVFHVSQLRKCLRLPEEEISEETVDLQNTMEYLDHTVKILDRAVNQTGSTTIPLCKILWPHHTEREATWEKEVDMQKEYPLLFSE